MGLEKIIPTLFTNFHKKNARKRVYKLVPLKETYKKLAKSEHEER